MPDNDPVRNEGGSRIHSAAGPPPRIPRNAAPRVYEYSEFEYDYDHVFSALNDAERIAARAEQAAYHLNQFFRIRTRTRPAGTEGIGSSEYTGIPRGYKSNPINNKTVFDSINVAEVQKDTIPFIVEDTTNGKSLQFVCTITGISETSTGDWSSTDFVGRPYPIHTYKGVDRSLSFDFKVYPVDSNDLKKIWTKINYFKGLTFPSQYVTNREQMIMLPPYVKLTIGDLYKSQPGFFTSIVMQIDDDTPWERGWAFANQRPNRVTDDQPYRFDNTDSVVERPDMPKLPHIASFNCSYTIIEKQLLKVSSPLHGFAPTYQEHRNFGTPAIDAPLGDADTGNYGDGNFGA